MKKLLLVLSFLAFSPAYGDHGKEIIRFDNGVVTLESSPCTLSGPAEPDEKMKNGQFVSTDGTLTIRLCWLKEDGQIWILDQHLNIFSVPASRVEHP
jgi:hypothetical protein